MARASARPIHAEFQSQRRRFQSEEPRGGASCRGALGVGLGSRERMRVMRAGATRETRMRVEVETFSFST